MIVLGFFPNEDDVFYAHTATIVSHKTPRNAGYKANAAGKKVNFTYYSAFAAE